MKERYEYIISGEDTEITIKEILKRRMGISSRLLIKLKKSNGVYLNGERIRLFEKGREGERIAVRLPEESSNFLPEYIPIDVIYEDSDLLAINKQPGFVVHPTKGHQEKTIANGLMQYMMDKGDSYKIRFINRLDMNTSGILLIGKNSHSQDDFAKQAKEGLVEKRYIAILKGFIPEDRGIINLPIDKPSEDSIKRAVMHNGYSSVTRYEVLERLKGGYTAVRVFLDTGRTHQIRVHMSHIGYPVAGDSLYGGEGEKLIGRQALHAEQLTFLHPAHGEKLTFIAPLPADMEHMMNLLR
jgi:23S rRNA pseudouridine1911/1915/1917 synthase